MQDQKIFMENEVELFKENGYWYVTDDEAGGYCEQYFNYEKALKDYEKRVKDKIEKRYTKANRLELPVIQNANDIGLDLTLPKRMGWTEFTEDNIVFHYSTEEEYNNCENAKRLGIKVSVSV